MEKETEEKNDCDNTSSWVNSPMSVFLLFHYEVYRYGRNGELTLLTDREKQKVQKRLCTSLQGTPWYPCQKNQMILRYLHADLEYMSSDLADNEVTLFSVGTEEFAIRKKPLRGGNGRRDIISSRASSSCDSRSSCDAGTQVQVTFS